MCRTNTKQRRHSGRKYAESTVRCSRKERLENPELEPQEYWDDWSDYRDGYRGSGLDRTRFSPKKLKKEHWGNISTRYNNKISKTERIRRIRIEKEKIKK